MTDHGVQRLTAEILGDRLRGETAARKNAEALATRWSEQFFALENELASTRAVFDATSDVIVRLRPDLSMLDLNAAGRQLAGLGPDEPVFEVTLARIVAPDHLDSLPSHFDGLANGPWHGEANLVRRDGSEVPCVVTMFGHRDGGSAITSLTFVARDLTERRAHEAELQHRSHYDALTGLPSQEFFMELVRAAVEPVGINGGRVVVMALDIADYRVVNETLGRDAGDRLLVAVADRLNGVLAGDGQMARIGAGEFGLVLSDLNEAEILQVGDRILDALRRPFVVESRQLVTRAAIGVARTRSGRERPEEMLRDAESALARANESGGDCCAVFDDAMRMAAIERLELEHELRRGIQRGDLRLHYQPEVRLETGDVVGYEALVRWQHPTRGLLAPGAFIDLAEATGLVTPLGQWVLHHAAAQLKLWHDRHPDRPAPFMSINVSPRQLVTTDFVRVVGKVLDVTGADASSIALELTENVFAQVDDRTLGALRRLRRLGVRLVVDDFGAGYSSLRYVKHFPIDVLKIDRSFIQNIVEDAGDRAIVQAVLAMASSMDIEVVAEGVEEIDQRDLLMDMGCDMAQGYLFGRPAPASDITFA